MNAPEEGTAARPRVEGDREQEILQATLDVLADLGYDRLTMDAVASAARASKATLYRRWSSKAALVAEAVCSQKTRPPLPDTGTLREDLLTAYCGMGVLRDPRGLALLAAVVTAMGRDEEFAEIYRRDFITPSIKMTGALLERAVARGEARPDLDVSLVAPALPGIVLHRVFLLGEEATPELISRVIDQIILPAVAPTPNPKDSHG
ncbi:TetR/AcrR family transcriptional regulator [Nocardioides houyundeii]|uniref:TetR/AcrR family transcriptional regulator n=1 Tax=Nocardioides houyundeii TaxID=2045452 RepID=UPI000C781DBC|nr:TetR/AcrR family transcriptional regulator [Nocardioides houyundeii]